MSIGETLATARRQAGLTVSQVSERTRVREPIIRGIENDDYSGCGGDFYARGHIRAIAKVIGVDPGPLIREYDAAKQTRHPIIDADVVVAPPPAPVTTATPATPATTYQRRRLIMAGVVALALVLVLGTYQLLSGSRRAATTAASAQAHHVTQQHAGRGKPNPPQPKAAGSHANPGVSGRAATAPSPGPTGTTPLTPVSAAAFGPSGIGQGDNPDLAPLAIDGDMATAWRTDWYTSASFGNLYPATGLLLDMGHPVTISRVQIRLGSAPGAAFELRAGDSPVLADLRPVAHAAGVGGLVRLRLAAPASGRYLLIWFTLLPVDPDGTFQASVHDVMLQGRP